MLLYLDRVHQRTGGNGAAKGTSPREAVHLDRSWDYRLRSFCENLAQTHLAIFNILPDVKTSVSSTPSPCTTLSRAFCSSRPAHRVSEKESSSRDVASLWTQFLAQLAQLPPRRLGDHDQTHNTPPKSDSLPVSLAVTESCVEKSIQR